MIIYIILYTILKFKKNFYLSPSLRKSTKTNLEIACILTMLMTGVKRNHSIDIRLCLSAGFPGMGYSAETVQKMSNQRTETLSHERKFDNARTVLMLKVRASSCYN
jgi:hypothetical protein